MSGKSAVDKSLMHNYFSCHQMAPGRKTSFKRKDTDENADL